jgi:hypothetical protein
MKGESRPSPGPTINIILLVRNRVSDLDTMVATQGLTLGKPASGVNDSSACAAALQRWSWT